MEETRALPPVVAVIGPTAVGKSTLALQLARRFGGEIITADSRQVYRYMDIGTDKPGRAERDLAPHHMIDLVDPDEAYTLALYQEGAYATIDDVLSRGNLPIVAGGTPLYVNAVLEGWTIPRVEPDLALRAGLEKEAEEHGSEHLHASLKGLDPTAAAGILPSNTRRIIRALEVVLLTGEPISVQQRKVAPPYRMLTVGITCPRKELYRRIDSRVDRQIDAGLVDEVASLLGRGYLSTLPSMSGLGYRQIGGYLLGMSTLEESIQRIKWDTHAFARHQANWFRRAGEANWIDTLESDALTTASDLVEGFLSGA
ncbi:MAG: tRNA (adenosine(37)-N6)-dimethylallyltransferase MiaA [Chloroflexota bacterium]|nr:tRNA (adenosine(37)-N6)-dimethylallyltransferase MiaA [Chloroflexota bacterium]